MSFTVDDLLLDPLTADPTPAVAGMVWYRSDLEQVRTYLPNGDVQVLNNVDTVGAGDIASASYVQARGGGLISNNTGLMGDNYNFTSFTWDPVTSPGLPASFRVEGYYTGVGGIGAIRNDELIPVDPNAVYEMGGIFRQEGVAGNFSAFAYGNRHVHYIGLNMYDVDGLSISARMHMKWPGSVRTTLAADLDPGDSTIQLADATGWRDAAHSYANSLLVMRHTNSHGYLYPNYSRERYPSIWTTGGINFGTNVITLINSWAGPAIPAGTIVQNGADGGTFKYSLAAGYRPDTTDQWYKLRGFIGGLDTSGTNRNWNFAPGTAFVRLLFLPNYSNRLGGWSTYPDTGAAQKSWFAGMTLEKRLDARLDTLANGSHNIITPISTAAVGGTETLTQTNGQFSQVAL